MSVPDTPPACGGTNLVSKLTFIQSAEVIRQTQVLICCDGGLMHAANAVNTKVISLLARLNSEMLITNQNSISLFDLKDVNNIKAEDIFIKFNEIINSSDNHHQDE